MLKDKKLFLFDIDGVIKLGDNIIDGSLELYNFIDSIGGKSIFIINNSTKSEEGYVSYFLNNGFNVNEDNFVTALTVTSIYLIKYHKNDLIYVVGTKMLVNRLKNLGLNITTRVSPNIKVVLVGYDNELNYNKIAKVCEILQTSDVTYLATNLDLRCPVTFGYVPDCGAIVEFIRLATEKVPKFLGKPSPVIIDTAVNLTEFDKSKALVIGDRLYTDIACGINAGVDTCLVFSGETKRENLGKSKIKPTYCFSDVKELLKALKNEIK